MDILEYYMDHFDGVHYDNKELNDWIAGLSKSDQLLLADKLVIHANMLAYNYQQISYKIYNKYFNR